MEPFFMATVTSWRDVFHILLNVKARMEECMTMLIFAYSFYRYVGRTFQISQYNWHGDLIKNAEDGFEAGFAYLREYLLIDFWGQRVDIWQLLRASYVFYAGYFWRCFALEFFLLLLELFEVVEDLDAHLGAVQNWHRIIEHDGSIVLWMVRQYLIECLTAILCRLHWVKVDL